MHSALSTNAASGEREFLRSAAILGREEFFRKTWSGNDHACGDPGREQAVLNSAESDPAVTGANSSTPEEASAGGKQRSVLVVDDEESIRDLLIAPPQDARYHAASAANGLDGLQRFRESHWDAVITDRNMPQLNGEDLAACIRAESPSTPIILISGAMSAVYAPDLFDVLIRKPFRLSGILTTLHSIFTPSPGRGDHADRLSW